MRYLVIEGNIGSGKTTLAKMLAEDMNAKLVLEKFGENPFLPKFYKNHQKYSFQLELSFLAERYSQTKREVLNMDLFHSLIIADYYFPKTDIFAQNTLEPDEYILFKKIFSMVEGTVPKPDLYVFLYSDTSKLLENIKNRGRDYEKNISEDYLEQIKVAYFRYLNKVKCFPILIIDINKIDFVKNFNHYQLIKKVLFKSDYKLGVNQLILP